MGCSQERPSAWPGSWTAVLVREVLLAPDTVTAMTTETPQSERSRQGYGFGIYTYSAAGSRWIGHDGSYGGFTSYGFSDVDDGV